MKRQKFAILLATLVLSLSFVGCRTTPTNPLDKKNAPMTPEGPVVPDVVPDIIPDAVIPRDDRTRDDIIPNDNNVVPDTTMPNNNNIVPDTTMPNNNNVAPDTTIPKDNNGRTGTTNTNDTKVR